MKWTTLFQGYEQFNLECDRPPWWRIQRHRPITTTQQPQTTTATAVATTWEGCNKGGRVFDIFIRCQFHQHFTHIFYKRSSQKSKKTLTIWLYFYTFGIFASKSLCKHIGEINPRSRVEQVQSKRKISTSIIAICSRDKWEGKINRDFIDYGVNVTYYLSSL